LKSDYATEPVYQVLERVFGEHFQRFLVHLLG
jgi:hypothetical protein